jgi:hypothetical protein
MGTSYIDELWQIFIKSPHFLRYKEYDQPEDRLQQALLDWNLNPTIHADLAAGYNRFMGKNIDSFSTSTPFRFLIDDLLSGKPWIGSGTFPGFPTLVEKPLGHIVCVVGMEYESDPYSPSAMIIDDPYGDTMNNWRGPGNDIFIPWKFFIEWMKPLKDPAVFWSHRLTV